MGIIILLFLLGALIVGVIALVKSIKLIRLPAFRIPIFMVFVPFGIHLVTEKNQKENIKHLSKVFLLSILFTLILGIKKHY